MSARSRVFAFVCLATLPATLQAQSIANMQATIAGSDLAAAVSVTNSWYRILPAATRVARNLPPSLKGNRNLKSATRLPQPGFYPADLVYIGGPVVFSAKQHLVYFDCSAACWGNPAAFLKDLNQSAFIHLTDPYVGMTANRRYPVGGTVTINQTLQTNVVDQNTILSIVHAAAVKLSLSSGYSHIVHIFLPRGVDTCIDLTSMCYSTDNPASFYFCAYHGSALFSDIGHILFTVEPYQNVPGCQVATPTPRFSSIRQRQRSPMKPSRLLPIPISTPGFRTFRSLS